MQKKKISIIADSSKNEGGANIAAMRICKILKKKYFINQIQPLKKDFFFFIKNLFTKILVKIFIGKTPFLNSFNLFDNIDLNKITGEILSIHWIGKNTISIKSLEKTKIPIIWTLHDMWPITSTEHFLDTYNEKGYSKKNLNNNFFKKKLFDQKKKLFRNKNFFLVTCCKWLERIAKKSEISRNSKITTIYNPIETFLWNRKNQLISKHKLRLDKKKNYILFGAQGGLSNPRKGGDLLIKIICKIKNFLISKQYEIIILGGKKNHISYDYGVKIHFRKYEKSIKKQILYHSAVNLTLSCSKAEALPQFLVETLLCKNPVVSFSVGGINEIISHKKNGFLVKPFNIDDFCKGIKFVINNKKKLQLKSKINYLKTEFNEKNILKKYTKLINSII